MNPQQQQRAQAICRLEVLDTQGTPIGGGTGFHYGGGWILTNSHVVGFDASRLPFLRITFDNLTAPRTYQPRSRVCFFVDITYHPNNHVDMERADVALFLLDETNLPPGINDQSFNPLAVPQNGNHQLAINETTYCLHYGWGNLLQRPQHLLVSQIETVTQIITPTNSSSPHIAVRHNFTTSGGSSGAPLFERSTNELVGIHFGTGVAVLFNPTIKHILGSLVLAIAEVRNLPQILNMYQSLPLNLQHSALKQINGRVNNILTSLGNASLFMRLYIPFNNGYIRF